MKKLGTILIIGILLVVVLSTSGCTDREPGSGEITGVRHKNNGVVIEIDDWHEYHISRDTIWVGGNPNDIEKGGYIRLEYNPNSEQPYDVIRVFATKSKEEYAPIKAKEEAEEKRIEMFFTWAILLGILGIILLTTLHWYMGAKRQKQMEKEKKKRRRRSRP